MFLDKKFTTFDAHFSFNHSFSCKHRSDQWRSGAGRTSSRRLCWSASFWCFWTATIICWSRPECTTFPLPHRFWTPGRATTIIFNTSYANLEWIKSSLSYAQWPKRTHTHDSDIRMASSNIRHNNTASGSPHRSPQTKPINSSALPSLDDIITPTEDIGPSTRSSILQTIIASSSSNKVVSSTPGMRECPAIPPNLSQSLFWISSQDTKLIETFCPQTAQSRSTRPPIRWRCSRSGSPPRCWPAAGIDPPSAWPATASPLWSRTASAPTICPCSWPTCIPCCRSNRSTTACSWSNRRPAASSIGPPCWMWVSWRLWSWPPGTVSYSTIWICCRWTIGICTRVRISRDTCRWRWTLWVSSKWVLLIVNVWFVYIHCYHDLYKMWLANDDDKIKIGHKNSCYYGSLVRSHDRIDCLKGQFGWRIWLFCPKSIRLHITNLYIPRLC